MPKKASEKASEVKKDFNAKFREKYGKDMITAASDVSPVYDIRLPTGIPGMDVALEGGIPRGIVAQLAGPDGVGKNALAYQTAGNYQEMRKKKAGVLLCPIEGEIDKMFARKLGFMIPLSEPELHRMALRLKRKLTKEEHEEFTREVGRVAQVNLGPAQDMLQTVLCMTEMDEFGLVIIDSMAALLDQDDMIRERGNTTEVVPVGGERPYARSINTTIGSFLKRFPQSRKCKPNGRENLTTVLAINQVRADTSGSGRAWKVSGSYALRHWKRVDIWLSQGTWITNPSTKKVLGHEIHWNIAKGQYGVHEHAKGTVRFLYETGFDVVHDLFETLHDNDLITHQGGGRWELCDADGEVLAEYGKDVGGKDGIVERLRADGEMRAVWQKALDSLYTTKPIYEGYDE